MSQATVLPQHMLFSQFAAQAEIKKLTNHGRGWEVFLHGMNLGFADGTKEEALRMAHFGAVNNAVYANDPDAPEWMTAEMPLPEVLSEYPDVVARFPWLSVGPDVAVEDVPLTRRQFNQYIEASCQDLEAKLHALIVLPANHRWGDIHNELTWYLSDPLQSTLHGMSLFIRLAVPDDRDEKQLHVEIRYGWQKRTLADKTGNQQYGGTQHKATVWCEQGSRFMGMYKSLFSQSALFFYADTIQQLAVVVAQAVNEGVASAVK